MTTTALEPLVLRVLHTDGVVLQESAFGRFSFAILKRPAVLFARQGLTVALFFCLSGCSSGSLLSDVTRAFYQERFGTGTDVTLTVPLNSSFRYLRVVPNGGRASLLVLGYLDPHPEGDIEVWYSADQEVIKTQNGRIVGTSGLPFDWRNVRFAEALPTWAAVNQSSQRLTRLRDEVNGYRYGISEQLTVEAMSGGPTNILPDTIPLAQSSQYSWYRESVLTDDLPVSWYAVGSYQGQKTVVYSFQCLGRNWCLSLQRWPPERALP